MGISLFASVEDAQEDELHSFTLGDRIGTEPESTAPTFDDGDRNLSTPIVYRNAAQVHEYLFDDPEELMMLLRL